MDQFKETELLRMTKDELINHIFDLYKIADLRFEELVRWYTVSEEIVLLRKQEWGE